MSSQRIAVAVQNVSVEYRTFLRRPVGKRLMTAPRSKVTVNALSDVTFEVPEGTALGIIGHNGSGKSTLINAVAGVLAPSSGRVLVRSQPMSLGAGSQLRPHLTARQNIHLGLLSIGAADDELAELESQVSSFVELAEFLDAPVSTFSLGMRARLRFALATMRSPDILLLDEALGFGDARFKERSLERIATIRDQAGAVLMATHDLAEIKRTCTQAIWLRDGKLEFFGKPADVIAAYSGDDGSARDTISR